MEWHGNGEIGKEEGSEVKVAWGREVEEEEQDAGKREDEMVEGEEVACEIDAGSGQ